MSRYYNKVHNVANHTSSKHQSGITHPKSILSVNKKWKETSIEFRTNGRKTLFPITSLFDTAKDKTLLEGAEKVFYNDQKLCLQCPAMYDVPCTTTQLLVVRLMENGPVSLQLLWQTRVCSTSNWFCIWKLHSDYQSVSGCIKTAGPWQWWRTESDSQGTVGEDYNHYDR